MGRNDADEKLIEQIVEAVRKRLAEEGGSGSPGGAAVGSSASGISPEAVAQKIDHTLLKADASEDELKRVCDEAKRYHFFSVCVNSANVPFVYRELQSSDVKTCAVVGFPLGAASASAKAFETREAVGNGAAEIDMVMNIGALKSKQYQIVLEDIKAVVTAASPAQVKVILETGLLSREEKIIACSISKAAGAAFVKTSTGFGPKGATVEDIRLMRSVVGPVMGVKASGGVRTWDDAISMIEAGATRLGASASVNIVTRKGSGSTSKGY